MNNPRDQAPAATISVSSAPADAAAPPRAPAGAASTTSRDAGNSDSLDTRGTFLLRTGTPIVDNSRVFAAQIQHGLNSPYDDRLLPDPGHKSDGDRH